FVTARSVPLLCPLRKHTGKAGVRAHVEKQNLASSFAQAHRQSAPTLWQNLALADGTPVGRARGVAERQRADRAAAAWARATGAVVDMLSGASAVHGLVHQPRGRVERRAQLVVGGFLQPEPRREPRIPERFNRAHVADA